MSESPDDISRLQNRYYGWAMTQVWKNQKRKDKNLRLVCTKKEVPRKNYKRVMPTLELIQEILQDWDPIKQAIHWKKLS